MDQVARFLTWGYPIWARSLRYRVEVPPFQGPTLFLIWHGRTFPVLWWFRNRGIRVLVSRHRDGQRAAALLVRLGYVPLWGSSTRGAVSGTWAILKALQEGHPVAITPDGPTGPPCQVKPGLLHLITRLEVPIILLGTAAFPARLLRSWDRFLLPFPFARTAIAGAQIPPAARPQTLEELNRALNGVERRARTLLTAAR